MQEVTPDELLELAREVMPDSELENADRFSGWPYQWHVHGPTGKVQRQHRDIPYMEWFDPIGNDAHAWAVYKWRKECDGSVYAVECESLEQANLLSALAVMRKMKEAKDAKEK